MDVPAERCGYTWPEDHDIDASPNQQSCCWRPTASEATERCLLHVDRDAVDADAEAVVDSLVPAAGPLRLDGADLSGLEIGYHTPETEERSILGIDLESIAPSPDELAEAVENNPAMDAPFEDPELLREFFDSQMGGTQSKTHPFEGVSLRDSDLSETNFWRTSLAGADLRDADLSAGKFDGTDFSAARLDGAVLSTGEFDDADFVGATLVDADLSDAEFGSVDFSDADLKYADLSNASLKSADLSNADFRDADLSNTYFSFTDVNGANLGFANLSETTL